ncbi:MULTISPECIES: polysaccharide deacetylase family protein [unclassified Streptomyces]|uniref:polysaccharide deacetylase family protein n=1 Tax=unclassified Streptomyces TaxID=2593676 RepID=UPI0037AAE03E
MIVCGISWGTEGYEAFGVDPAGRGVFARSFPPGAIGGLTEYLRAWALEAGDGRFVGVVESTNGTIDLHLMNAGLSIARADPWMLPGRPVNGSVSAAELARHAAAAPDALTHLDLRTGTLGGRADVLDYGLRRRPELHERFAGGGALLERGAGDLRRVALTFDDGPCPPYTGRILDILARYRLPATFFCVGLQAAAHGDTLRRMVDEGHSLGNHTWSHPFLPDLRPEEFAFQIDATGQTIARATGIEPRFVRPPYGFGTTELLEWTSEKDMSCVLWDNDSHDWSSPGPEAIAERTVRQAGPGSIILMHDGGGDRSGTVQALPGIIEQLLDGGYEMVGIEQMVAPDPGGTDQEGNRAELPGPIVR